MIASLDLIDYISIGVIVFGVVSIIGGVAYMNRGVAIADQKYVSDGFFASISGVVILLIGTLSFLALNWNNINSLTYLL